MSRSSRPVCERGNDQACGIAQVLIGVLELSITDVGKAVLLFFIPVVTQLRKPGERIGAVHLDKMEDNA